MSFIGIGGRGTQSSSRDNGRSRAESAKFTADIEALQLHCKNLDARCDALDATHNAISSGASDAIDEIRATASGMGLDISALYASLDGLFSDARESGILTEAMNKRLALVESKPAPPSPPPPQRIDLSPYAAKSRVETLNADLHAIRHAFDGAELTRESEAFAAKARTEATDYKIWLMFWAVFANTVVSLIALWSAT